MVKEALGGDLQLIDVGIDQFGSSWIGLHRQIIYSPHISTQILSETPNTENTCFVQTIVVLYKYMCARARACGWVGKERCARCDAQWAGAIKRRKTVRVYGILFARFDCGRVDTWMGVSVLRRMNGTSGCS